MISINWFYLINYFFENITKQIAFLDLPAYIFKKQRILCKYKIYFMYYLPIHISYLCYKTIKNIFSYQNFLFIFPINDIYILYILYYIICLR